MSTVLDVPHVFWWMPQAQSYGVARFWISSVNPSYGKCVLLLRNETVHHPSRHSCSDYYLSEMCSPLTNHHQPPDDFSRTSDHPNCATHALNWGWHVSNLESFNSEANAQLTELPATIFSCTWYLICTKSFFKVTWKILSLVHSFHFPWFACRHTEFWFIDTKSCIE